MTRSRLAALALAIAASFAAPAFADPPAHARGNSPHAQGRHDNGLHRGWDRHRFNGYTHEGHWYYGPPPASLGDVVLGYRMWRRGDLLPDYYKDSLGVVDYRTYHLA